MIAKKEDLIPGYFVFFNCYQSMFEVPVVNVFFCKVLAVQILRYSRALLALN